MLPRLPRILQASNDPMAATVTIRESHYTAALIWSAVCTYRIEYCSRQNRSPAPVRIKVIDRASPVSVSVSVPYTPVPLPPRITEKGAHGADVRGLGISPSSCVPYCRKQSFLVSENNTSQAAGKGSYYIPRKTTQKHHRCQHTPAPVIWCC